MELVEKVALKLTPEEKETIAELKGILTGYCIASNFPQCVNCPFDRNKNGKCIKAQFFSTLDKLID